MITVKTNFGNTILRPTIFPDGTSQIWKVPPEILNSRDVSITWRFEKEREIIDLYSFMTLLTQPVELRHVSLHIPYLPYARQDKAPSNDSTFNLCVLTFLLEKLGVNSVTAVDVHNPKHTSHLMSMFENIYPSGFHEKTVYDFRPTFIMFPDKGAMDRYGKSLSHINTIFCEKVRDQTTGEITDLKVNLPETPTLRPEMRVLIVDDICDGGATFIRAAKALRIIQPEIEIGLCVTHGIFSKGRQHLLDNGIDKIYTTDSLLKNDGSYEV